MYRQQFFTDEPDSLEHVVPFRDYLRDFFLKHQSLFGRPPMGDIFLSALGRCAIAFVSFIERAIGTQLYVQNELRELSSVDPRIRKTLLYLLGQDIISSWSRLPCVPDRPPVVCYKLGLNPITLPSGRSYAISGAAAEGGGATTNSALTVAIAEGIERYSVSRWDANSIIHGSFEEFESRGAISPQEFDFFTKEQRRNREFDLSNMKNIESERIGWISARELVGRNKVLVPAQPAFIFYEHEHRKEPWFIKTTTSGSAASADFEEAAYRAVCELVERDSFLVFWLSRLAPPQVELGSINIPEICKKIALYEMYDFNLYVLDITTDLGVFAYMVVILDQRGEAVLSLGSAAGLDDAAALVKAFQEAEINLHELPAKRYSNSQSSENDGKYLSVRTLDERRELWGGQNMRTHFDFFLNGERRAFNDLKSGPKDVGKKPLEEVRAILKEKEYSCYLVDATSPLARRFGLCVARALAPGLVPMYFDEKRKPLGIKRLYEVPVAMGYRAEPLAPSELNAMPHPFL